MSPSSADGGQLTIRGGSPLPAVLFVTGVLLTLIAAAQAAFALGDGRPALEALLDLVFIAVPGLTFAYTGYWLPRSEVTGTYYPRIVAWMLGGILVMFGFVVLRDIHPGVTAEWSVGTQAIALTIGSVGGLLIGIQETRATIRTAQLEDRQAELEKRTAELEANERELERQNAQLEQFASVVSHDLRNPLSVAQGNVDLLRDEYEIDRLDTVSDAHDRMETLIEDLLTLARQGDAIRGVESVGLAELSRACWEQVATEDATVSIDDPPMVMADRDRLRQLLENLFRNSVEHGGEGPNVTVGTLDDGNGFYVADDGPGIPESERDRVFESGHSTVDSGTGFGLAIVAEIAEAHGWDVHVADATGGGVRFEITGVEFPE
ncbi:signal transduction histidine kinase [Halorubrum alkaliphilum]|uniref:histidine kinase n=1 Tax=Halorubrum alkaliphilum TaxID=261290 RepID=A0A8T4GFJ5_9EURY|nr:HAMP domain-containing sensor histidine kinase [Halorubrum alkaliphilum]MBP1922903.1 signal transduction histidine kinase [Halorubrum alkaliphilum]